MKTKGALVFLSLIVLVDWGFAQEIKPVAVSPGSENRVARVSERCPTFSWSALGWAVGYRVAVFETKTAEVKTYESLALTAAPVLKHEIQGKALSWTPSEGERLRDGGLYVWYVQARDGAGNGLWSVGKTFLVEADKTQLIGVEDRVTKKLRERGVASDVISEVAREVRSGAKAGIISKDFTLKRQEQRLAGVQVGNGKQTSKGVKDQGNEIGSNTYYGELAGASLSSGTNNSFFGNKAGYYNTTGYCNTFIGFEAGCSNVAGRYNTFIGTCAGKANTATDGTFLGYQAGRFNTTGSSNTFIGKNAGYTNTTGSSNTFLGICAGESNTTASSNTFLGRFAGRSNTTGSYNLFLGDSAGYSNDTGYSNTFLGLNAGSLNISGIQNTFIGNEAGYANTASNGTFLGYHAGYSNTTGTCNTFLGLNAGYSNAAGGLNTFIGQAAGSANSTGNYNTFLGLSAGYSNTAGHRNVFLGYKAGYSETGSDKLYIQNSDASFPLIYGDFSSGLVGVNGKLGVGIKSPSYPLHVQTSGTSALMVLSEVGGALSFMTSSASAGAFGTQNNYPVQILAKGLWRMQINTDNSLSMASGATCTIGGAWTNASSRSLKENIRDLRADDAQATLAQLAPVRFNYKADREEECLGFIAEDVPTLVATKDRKGLSPMDIVAVLTKVVQEQQKMIDDLRAEIDALKQKTK